MRVAWTAPAREDRRRIVTYLSERNRFAATRLIEALIVAADSLSNFPERGRIGQADGTRELAAPYPYLLVYEVDRQSNVIRILRVWHGAQDR